MKKFLKWLGFVVVSFIAIVIFAMIYVYFASEREFARQYKVAETLSVSLPTDAAEIEEGHRLAHITGCTHCHGDNLAEPSIIDIPGIARFVPPNISRIVPTMSDAQLVGLLRRGVKLDGTSAWLMPAEMFRHLHDRGCRAHPRLGAHGAGERRCRRENKHPPAGTRSRRDGSDQTRRAADRRSRGRPGRSVRARRLSRHECVQRMPRPGSQGCALAKAPRSWRSKAIRPSNSRDSCTTAWASVSGISSS